MEGVSTITNFFTRLPIDSIILGSTLILVSLLVLRTGPGRIINLGLAALIGISLWQLAERAVVLHDVLETSNSSLVAGSFLLAVALLYVLVSKIIGTSFSGRSSPVSSVIVGVCSTLLLLVTWLEVPELETLWNFGPSIETLFGGTYALWWIILSLGGLAFVRR